MKIRFDQIAPFLAYNLLVKYWWLEERRYTKDLWRWAWQVCGRYFKGPVPTKIHGQWVVVNFGYAYPWLARKFPNYNQPLVELVYQASMAKQAPVTFVDIGAAIGDTILLVDTNCPGMIGRFICVDGDPEFFGYLQKNLGSRQNGNLLFALLSSSTGTERSLVRTHAGTASAQGDAMVPSNTLDSLLLTGEARKIDVLKIDVDGFDGKVLLGAKQVLSAHAPAVIFEWHPILCGQAGNNWTDHFDALVESGYCTFLWFTKFGEFSYISKSPDHSAVRFMAQVCIRNRHVHDWHYDIVALHRDSKIVPLDLAELHYAKHRRSRW